MKNISYFDPQLDKVDRSEAIECWIKMTVAGPDSSIYEENFWAFEYYDLMTDDHPIEALSLIIDTLKMNQTGHIVGNLAAGPLEDLLARNGRKIIGRVETEAKSNPLFSKLIAGVWQNSMSDEIWNRVQAISDKSGLDQLYKNKDNQSQ
ncbi:MULTISPECIES: DUF6869 domain-containing protein [unclassified Lentimonas]|uniref:DUF6869 domain-containing protein n=1 Tax=unclassified Lentimonas TaxID=2630993 RepID=UPI0013249644|nr:MULTISPECIES: hypothetical protein [unclassified Lentimonas]CAA6692138.1 Unannotated [Lentimonas sp. CC19]CAA6694470.1 Unannotated [Lentimonas sp. CC10]CAA7070609.1 Unannotated [Lentimonas sp. CC11]